MVSLISLTHTSQGHAKLSVLTFNCYGLKSSLDYVKELMNTNNVIFLNEHWLMDSDILVIKDILSEYDVYMKSNMDCESNACGRPFDRIGCICKQNDGFRCAPVQCTSDRLMGLHVYVGKSRTKTTTLYGAYMPFNNNTASQSELYMETLDVLSELIELETLPTS